MLLAMTVLAAFFVWLGSEWRFVHERRAFLSAVEHGDEARATTTKLWQIYFKEDWPNRVPFWGRWLGDEAIATITLPLGATQPETRRVRRLFPEAIVETSLTQEESFRRYEILLKQDAPIGSPE
ncbi:MAG TPA: hypothetical protein VGJ26_04640 [Pirellulales bacterium]